MGKYTALNKRTRDDNIRISKTRPRKKDTDRPKPGKAVYLKPAKAVTRKDIERAVRPIRTMKTKKAKEKPWLIMKPQEKLMVETDTEISGFIESTYIKEKDFGDGLKERGDWRRTSLAFGHCKKCPRATYYDFFEPHKSRKYTTKGEILFDEGKRHHKNIQSRLDDMGKMKNSEGYLHIDEVNANGYYDGLIPVGTEGRFTVCDILEIKSKGAGGMSVLQNDYDQAQLYLYASKFSKSLKAAKIKTRNIRILYKDRSCLAENIHYGWTAFPDIDRQNDIMEYMRFLWNVVYGQKKLFPHPYERKSNNCKWCRYHEHCWKGFAFEPKEADISKIMEVETPTEEIVKSFSNRLYMILKEERKLKAEKDTMIPALLKYFISTQTKLYPIADGEGLGVSQGKLSEWDTPGLIGALGFEMFSQISKPDGNKITALIKREYIDAGKFEQFRSYKLSKPSIQIRKVKND